MKVAVLDAAWAVTSVAYHEDDYTPAANEVVIPDHSDIDQFIGRAFWNAESQSFDIKKPTTEDGKVQEPNVLLAIARGFMAIRDSQPLPQVTLDWLTWFEATIDNVR